MAQVWSTAPLAALTRLVDPAPPPAVTAVAGQLRHRAMVLLYVVLDQPRWTEFDAHYFPGPEVTASRLSEPRNYRDSADDPPDRTVLCAELPCWVGDATWKADDGDLAAALAAELTAAGLPPVWPAAVTSRRSAHVYPVYGPDVAGDLATVERWADTLPRPRHLRPPGPVHPRQHPPRPGHGVGGGGGARRRRTARRRTLAGGPRRLPVVRRRGLSATGERGFLTRS